MEFRCVFLNCYSLYEPATHSTRGPANSAERNRKLSNIAATIHSLFSTPPELIALGEVASERLAFDVGEAIAGRDYKVEWSSVPPLVSGEPETSLALLYDPLVFERPDPVALKRPELAYGEPWRAADKRDKWFPVLFQLLQGSRAPFWLVVNHWKSRRGYSWQTDKARQQTAHDIGRFYRRTARLIAEEMILIGDFNCEPGERPLFDQKLDKESSTQLRAVRERALVLRKGNRLAYFYNPMWRWLGEQHPYEETLLPGTLTPDPAYSPDRLMGTHCNAWQSAAKAATGRNQPDPTDDSEFPDAEESVSGWNLWDQIMVTKPLLTGNQIQFKESSVVLAPPIGGCSDHSAIGAVFSY